MRIRFPVKRGTHIRKCEKHWDKTFDLWSRSTKMALVTVRPRSPAHHRITWILRSLNSRLAPCSCTVVLTRFCVSVPGSQTRFSRGTPSPEEGYPWFQSKMRREGVGTHRLQSLWYRESKRRIRKILPFHFF